MPEADLTLLQDAALAAGEIALKYFRADPETWDKGGGQGPVTEADLEIDRMLRHELLAARPDYGWLSEETEDNTARLHHDHVFIIDPIDGTRAFINGEQSFSHSLAIARRGQVVAGVVHLPVRAQTYAARAGAGASLNGAAINVSGCTDIDAAQVLGARPNFDAGNWRGGAPGWKRHFRPSLAYRLALVGQGRFDAMLTLRAAWEWDVAAGDLIVTQAGGAVSGARGEATSYNNPTPQLSGMIAAPKNLHTGIVDRLMPHLKTPIA